MITGPTRMRILQTFVVIILFIGETFCFLVDARNNVATLTDQDSEKEHDGKLVDRPGKTGYYDAAPKNTKTDYMHRIIKRHTDYIKNGEPHDITALVYTDVTFECEPYANHAEHVKWVYHDSKTKKVTNSNLKNGIKKKNTTTVDGGPQNLLLFNVTHSDEGWYTCVAYNHYRTDYASAYLKVVNELENSVSYKSIFEKIGIAIFLLCIILFILYLVLLNYMI